MVILRKGTAGMGGPGRIDQSIHDLTNVAIQKGFKMVYLNIRSLVNKYNQINIELEKSMIDIFSISETWLTTGVDSNILQIKSYNLIRHDRSHIDTDTGIAKRGGGLAIYHANALSFDNNKWAHLNVSSPHIEAQVVKFIRDKVRNIVFINVYRPPNRNVQTLIDHMAEILSNIPRLDRKDEVFMGDFNVDLLSNSLDAKKLIRFHELNGLLQLIKTPTRISPISASMIDLIFCSITHVSSSGTLDMFISDHLPIYLIKKMNTSLGQNNIKRTFTGRTYRNYTVVDLHSMIDRNMDVPLHELWHLQDLYFSSKYD